MMNLGSEKGLIVRKKGFNEKVFKVLELGCYCGYSSLVFAN
jgi:predicted O-methyltransferase YrrM